MSTVFETKKIALSSNETNPTKWMLLGEGRYKVDVNYETGVTGTVTPKQTMNITDTAQHKDTNEDGTALNITASRSFLIYGPAYLGFKVASLAGGNINAEANKVTC